MSHQAQWEEIENTKQSLFFGTFDHIFLIFLSSAFFLLSKSVAFLEVCLLTIMTQQSSTVSR